MMLRMWDWRRLLERLAAPHGVAIFAALIFGAALLVAAQKRQWDASAFVCAGAQFCDRAATPAELRNITTHSGYDGQFYYRLSLAPFSPHETQFGIRIDNPPYRWQRVLYPLTAWLMAQLTGLSTLHTLILTNYIAAIGIAYLAALVAERLGRPPAAGLLIALYPGLLLTLARDTTEALELAWLLAAVLARLRGWMVLTGVALALAVLSKETAIGVAVVLALSDLFNRIADPRTDSIAKLPQHGNESGRRSASSGWPAWAIPLCVFATMQIATYLVWGEAGVRAGRGNLVTPLSGISRVLFWESTGRSTSDANRTAEIIAVILFVGAVLVRMRSSAVPLWIRLGFCAYLALAACLGPQVWEEDYAFGRALGELYVFGACILLGSPRSLIPRGLAVVALGWFMMLLRARRG